MSPAELDAAIARTARRYRRVARARAATGYVAAKLRRDPVVRAIASRAPLGAVLDIGCGRGQLAVFLLESGAAARAHGVDFDAEKISLATRAADGLSASFVSGDARAIACDSADTVLLVDVLHYLPLAEQDALLARAASLVAPGGRLLLRDATTGLGVRSGLTRILERVGVTLGANRAEVLEFRDIAREVVPALERAGLSCSVEPCWAGTPLANVLVEAKR